MATKVKQLIWDGPKDIAVCLPPESGISEHKLLRCSSGASTVARQRQCLATTGKGSDLMKMMATEMAAQRLESAPASLSFRNHPRTNSRTG
ncbi:hypothetical protein [Sinorhizobium meliloti]|uniref:hypothetical protein n=1 Tax=Rhizobium meliloti TaxID=382 RepID=UPI0013E2C1D1|nr:hypothetical protein [Sinorhizobium meliloti]QND29499.1 hypothetical protein HB773_31575 [Sinorhizobium meliloti]